MRHVESIKSRALYEIMVRDEEVGGVSAEYLSGLLVDRRMISQMRRPMWEEINS